MAKYNAEQLQVIATQLGQQANPESVYLFGSYAWGSPTEASDVDLLVVTPFDTHPVVMAAALANYLPPELPADLLVRTPEFIQERLEAEDDFICDIITRGKPLWGKQLNGTGSRMA